LPSPSTAASGTSGTECESEEREYLEKLIISVGVVGGTYPPDVSPHLPLSPEEIAESAYEAHLAGAAIAHIHVRDDAGVPCHDLERYQKVIDLIGERCDMIVNLTTDLRDDDGANSLDLQPEIASFPGGTIHLGERVLWAPMSVLRSLAERFKAAGARPELEILHEGMIDNCAHLAEEGLLEEPLYFQFFLGVPGGAPATAKSLLHLVESIPPRSVWTVDGLGTASVGMVSMAIMLGGHARVGLEDTLEYRSGELAQSNAQLVRRVATLAEAFDRELASPPDARRILGLKGANTGARA
jgi:3-keto-5-aminohexanoate cleavage enzyme